MTEYGVLVYAKAPADPMSLTPEYLEALDRYPSQVEELGGRIVTGFAFAPEATSIRGSNVTDEPLSGGDLIAVGYYVLEAPDHDTAVRIARLNPATTDGGVEVRPLFVPPTE